MVAPLELLTVIIQWTILICGGSWIIINGAGFLMQTIRDQFPSVLRKKSG